MMIWYTAKCYWVKQYLLRTFHIFYEGIKENLASNTGALPTFPMQLQWCSNFEGNLRCSDYGLKSRPQTSLAGVVGNLRLETRQKVG